MESCRPAVRGLAKSETSAFDDGGGSRMLVAAVGCANMRKEHTMSPQPSPTKFVLSPAAEYQPLLTGKPQTAGMRSGRVVLSDGGCNERHTTGNHEETLVFLAGSGQVRCEGHESILARAGEIVYIPPNTVHQVCADAGVELRYVYIVAPVEPERR